MRKYLLFALLFVLVSSPEVFGAERLTLLHVNDLHGRLLPSVSDRGAPEGGAACLASMIKAERASNPGGTILLAAGDMFHGAPVSDLFRGRSVLDVMNGLGFDAMVIGNHELDWGRQTLRALVDGSRFPFLSANILDGSHRFLKGVRPYVIVERKGVKVAVIGLTTTETASIVKREAVSRLHFLEPERVLPPLMDEVRREGARIIVLLTHLGIDEDIRLARAVPGIDVIVGGHSHTVLSDPVRVGRTIIVQAGCYGLYLGVLQIVFDEKTGTVEGSTERGELVAVRPGRCVADGKTAAIVEAYEGKIRAEMERVVGETRIDLMRSREAESTLGDAVADAMREATGADAAIQNRGALRADIRAGRITMGQVYTALPFDDALVSMDMSGADLLGLFEAAARQRRGFPQVSGMEVSYVVAADGGRRVSAIRIGGKPLRSTGRYRVVTNDYLAAGGDGLVGFRKGSRVRTGPSVRDAFVGYLKAHSPLGAPKKGRIKWGGPGEVQQKPLTNSPLCGTIVLGSFFRSRICN